MRRTYITWLCAIAIVISTIFTFNIIPTVKADPDPPHLPGGTVYFNQNWFVDAGDNLEYYNQTIVLSGVLRILIGGSLTLKNVTLKTNNSYDGEYYIYVFGALTLKDWDDDKATTFDRTMITSATDFHYKFNIISGATFVMKHTIVSECGWDWTNHGMEIWANNAVIDNSKFTNNYCGVYVYSDNCDISNSNFTGNEWHGVFFSGSTGSKISNTEFSEQWPGRGIETDFSTDLTVDNCSVFGDYNGYWIRHSNNIIIKNCVINGPNNDIRLDQTESCVVTNNTFLNGSKFYVLGDKIQHYDHTIPLTNYLRGRPIYYFYNLNNEVIENINSSSIIIAWSDNMVIRNLTVDDGHALTFSYITNSLIENCTSRNNFANGLAVVGSKYNTFQYCDIIGNRLMIVTRSDYNDFYKINAYNGATFWIYGTSYNVNINWCTVNNGGGFRIQDGINTVVSNCTSEGNNGGLLLNFCRDVLITDSTFKSNDNGIEIHNSDNNEVSNCTISDNTQNGVHMNDGFNNIIIHNNFINNVVHVYDQTSNIWDDGYPSGGNYWDDYTGVDIFSGPNQDQPGSDGIGDTPYIIDADSQDNYPLMDPLTPPVDFANATGPQGAGHDPTITITYDWTGTPTAVDLYYSTDHGGSWNYLGTDTSVDGSYDWGPESNPAPKPSKYYWIANAQNGADDVGIPADGTPPEAGPYNWKTYDLTINDMQPLSNPPGYWEFVSIPLDVNGDLHVVFDDENWGDGGTLWDYIQWYDANDIVDPWKSYSIYRPPELNDPCEMNNMMGCWIHIISNDGDGVLTVGEGVEASSTAIPLSAGWNLVGYPTMTEMMVADALWGTGADNVMVCDISEPYHIKEVGPTYVMKPGEGYWVHVVADTVWVVDW